MTRKLLMLLLLASVMSAPARAEQKTPRTWTPHLGMRTAYALPFGVFTGWEDSLYLYNIYLGTVPLWVDAELPLTRNLRVGAFAQYAMGHLREGCDTCEGSDLGAGLQVSYHFNPQGPTDGWAGLGVGYEWTHLSFSEAVMHYRGPALHLQGGGDYHLGGMLWAGPFVNLTVGQYTHLEVAISNRRGVESIRHRAPHFWLGFGLRVQVRPDTTGRVAGW